MSKAKRRAKKEEIMRRQKWKYINRRYPFFKRRTDWYNGTILTKKRAKIFPPMFSADDGGVPEGWVIGFGHELCEELRNEFTRCGCIDRVTVSDVKEKYGELRIYMYGVPEGCKVYDILEKYKEISKHTCFFCGKKDVHIINCGWIIPCCEDCYTAQDLASGNIPYGDAIID